MKTRAFDNELEVPEIGLGCWQSGGGWHAGWDNACAQNIFEAAYRSGTRFYDTANVYGDGESEKSLGQFRKKYQDIFIASKVGRGDIYPDQYSYETLKADTQASLERLGLRSLDLTQLHCVPTEVLKHGDIFDWMRQLKAEGLFSRFGASVESVEEGLICLDQEGVASLQVIFNIFRQKPAELLFKKAKEKGVAIIVRLPLASGLLTGKINQSTTFDPDDHRSTNRNGEHFNVGETFAGLELSKGIELSRQLNSMLPYDIAMSQSALRWILDHDAVTVVIPGASRETQAVSNSEVTDIEPLGDTLHMRLKDWYEAEVRDYIRGPY